MWEQMKRISLRTSSVWSKVEPDLYTGSGSVTLDASRLYIVQIPNFTLIGSGPEKSENLFHMVTLPVYILLNYFFYSNLFFENNLIFKLLPVPVNDNGKIVLNEDVEILSVSRINLSILIFSYGSGSTNLLNMDPICIRIHKVAEYGSDLDPDPQHCWYW